MVYSRYVFKTLIYLIMTLWFGLAQEAPDPAEEWSEEIILDFAFCSRSFDLEGRSLEELLEPLRKNYESLYNLEGEIAPFGIIYQKVKFDGDGKYLEEGTPVSIELGFEEKLESVAYANPLLEVFLAVLMDGLSLDELKSIMNQLKDDPLELGKPMVLVIDLETDDPDIAGYAFDVVEGKNHFVEEGMVAFHFKRISQDKAVFCVDVDIQKIKPQYVNLFKNLKYTLPLPRHGCEKHVLINYFDWRWTKDNLAVTAEKTQWKCLTDRVQEEIGVNHGRNLPLK